MKDTLVFEFRNKEITKKGYIFTPLSKMQGKKMNPL